MRGACEVRSALLAAKALGQRKASRVEVLKELLLLGLGARLQEPTPAVLVAQVLPTREQRAPRADPHFSNLRPAAQQASAPGPRRWRRTLSSMNMMPIQSLRLAWAAGTTCAERVWPAAARHGCALLPMGTPTLPRPTHGYRPAQRPSPRPSPPGRALRQLQPRGSARRPGARTLPWHGPHTSAVW